MEKTSSSGVLLWLFFLIWEHTVWKIASPLVPKLVLAATECQHILIQYPQYIHRVTGWALPAFEEPSSHQSQVPCPPSGILSNTDEFRSSETPLALTCPCPHSSARSDPFFKITQRLLGFDFTLTVLQKIQPLQRGNFLCWGNSGSLYHLVKCLKSFVKGASGRNR